MPDRTPVLPNVATVSLKGRIGRAVRPEDMQRQLHLAERLPFIRGVLLRIDSPGGAATESEDIRVEIAKLNETKPVVAHIHGIGASGGYLAAAAAEKIIATKWSLVGSIGVLLMRPNVTTLLNTIGVDVAVRKTGRFKDLGSPFRAPTTEDEDKDAELIESLYREFLDTVIEARNLDETATERLTSGEVFTAAQAVELGLVDAVGDEEAATDQLEELIGAKTKTLDLRTPGGMMRFLRPAALAERAAGPLGSLSFKPRLEWPGGGF